MVTTRRSVGCCEARAQWQARSPASPHRCAHPSSWHRTCVRSSCPPSPRPIARQRGWSRRARPLRHATPGTHNRPNRYGLGSRTEQTEGGPGRRGANTSGLSHTTSRQTKSVGSRQALQTHRVVSHLSHQLGDRYSRCSHSALSPCTIECVPVTLRTLATSKQPAPRQHENTPTPSHNHSYPQHEHNLTGGCAGRRKEKLVLTQPPKFRHSPFVGSIQSAAVG